MPVVSGRIEANGRILDSFTRPRIDHTALDFTGIKLISGREYPLHPLEYVPFV